MAPRVTSTRSFPLSVTEISDCRMSKHQACCLQLLLSAPEAQHVSSEAELICDAVNGTLSPAHIASVCTVDVPCDPVSSLQGLILGIAGTPHEAVSWLDKVSPWSWPSPLLFRLFVPGCWPATSSVGCGDEQASHWNRSLLQQSQRQRLSSLPRPARCLLPFQRYPKAGLPDVDVR